jgi:hypothetical protein
MVHWPNAVCACGTHVLLLQRYMCIKAASAAVFMTVNFCAINLILNCCPLLMRISVKWPNICLTMHAGTSKAASAVKFRAAYSNL